MHLFSRFIELGAPSFDLLAPIFRAKSFVVRPFFSTSRENIFVVRAFCSTDAAFCLIFSSLEHHLPSFLLDLSCSKRDTPRFLLEMRRLEGESKLSRSRFPSFPRSLATTFSALAHRMTRATTDAVYISQNTCPSHLPPLATWQDKSSSPRLARH